MTASFLLLAVLIFLRFGPVRAFVSAALPLCRVASASSCSALHSTLLSDETIARLQKDYRDLHESFRFQANYFQQVAEGGVGSGEITEDSLEQTAYLAHLQRFQQEQLALEAAEEHNHKLQDLEVAQKEFQRLHDSKLMQEFEYESAKAEEAEAEDRQERALRLVKLLKDCEQDLRDALRELRHANNMDQFSQAEMRKHEALIQTFKSHLIQHDPFKGNIAF